MTRHCVESCIATAGARPLDDIQRERCQAVADSSMRNCWRGGSDNADGLPGQRDLDGDTRLIAAEVGRHRARDRLAAGLIRTA